LSRAETRSADADGRGHLDRSMGYLVLALAGCALAAAMIHAGGQLLAGGDVLSVGILSEPYHWILVELPERIDRERVALIAPMRLQYPSYMLSHLPFQALQHLVPGLRTAHGLHSMSLLLVQLALSCLYFVGVERGLSRRTAAIITLVVMANPLLLVLLSLAPIYYAGALLPLAYLAYRRRLLRSSLLLLLASSFSYRIGALFVLLLFLAIRDPSAILRRFNRRTAVVLAVAVAVQIATQFALLWSSDILAALEGGKIRGVFERLIDLLQGDGGNPASFLIYTLIGTLVWLLASGLVFLRGHRRRWGLALAGVIGGYMLVVTGALSQGLLLSLSVAGIWMVEVAAAGREAPPSNAVGMFRRVWPGRVPAWAVAGTLAAWLLIPSVPGPVPLRDVASGAAPFSEGLVTPATFLRRAWSLEPDPGFGQAQAWLDEAGPAELCLVEPHLMFLVDGRTCRRMVAVGKDTPEAFLPQADRVLLDLRPGTPVFRREFAPIERERYLGPLDQVARSPRLGLERQADGLCLFLPGGTGVLDRADFERLGATAFPAPGEEDAL
jgi:hypothetical protein